MTARQIYYRLVLAFGLSFLITPVVAAIMDGTKWHRVATRVFLITVVLLFVARAGHPRGWIASVRAMGLRGPKRGRRWMFGAALGAGLFAALLAAEILLDARAVGGEVKRSVWAQLGRAFFTAFNVSIVEELLCRGYLKDTIGGRMSAFLYAVAHYFKPVAGTQPADGYDPLLVFRRFPELLGGWTEPQNIVLGVPSLFLFGLALNHLRERTGTLYMCIGLHFGLVLMIKYYPREVTRMPLDGNTWLWGGPRLYDGIVGIACMGLLYLWARRGRVYSAETPLPRAA